MHMHPLRLSLFALVLFAVLGLSQEAEGSPQANIESIRPQIINLDDLNHLEIEEMDWKNESYVYENHDNFNPNNHTWTYNHTVHPDDSGENWGSPNPVWDFDSAISNQDEDKDMIWGPTHSCNNDGNGTNTEFCMYYSGGSGSIFTENYDVSNLEYNTSLYLKHRYNFDYYSGMTSAYNGGNVRISTDNGTSWALIYPFGGYPGTIYDYEAYNNPLYGQPGFVHCGDCSGVSGSASDNEDKWITSRFDIGNYLNTGYVQFQFTIGMYKYQYPGDGEHWFIDEIALASSPSQLTFIGNASDANSNITDYRWNSSINGNFGDQKNVSFQLANFERFSEGNHTISFIAKNQNGEWSSEDYSWVLIFNNPKIVWLNLPDNLSNNMSSSIVFNVTTVVNYTTACRLDGGDWYNCGLTNNFTNLTEGEHSFAVNVTDEFGYSNFSYFNWTIDITPPIVNIISGPDFVVSFSNTSSLAIMHYEYNLTFECRLYSNGLKWHEDSGDDCDWNSDWAEIVRYEAGELQYWIRATDNANNTSNWSKWVWNQVNYYVVNIIPSSAYRHDNVTFSGYATEVSGCNMSFAWISNINGVVGTAINSTTANLSLGEHNITFSIIYSCNGNSWYFEDSREDDTGVENSVTIMNRIPDAEYTVFNSGEMRQYTPVSVSCSASDADGSIVKYRWALVSSYDRQNISKDVILYEGMSPNTNFTNISVGYHWITCRALDNDGAWNWVNAITSIVIRNNTNPEAIIREMPSLAIYRESVTFIGDFRDDNDTVDRYKWTSNIDGLLSKNRNFTISNLSAGTHWIKFQVRDPEGLWGSKNREILVNIAPTAYAGENVSTTPNIPVQFNGQGEDEDGEIVFYEWDFDGNGIYDWADENNGREINLYNNAGTYTAVLRVTDDNGATATSEVTIRVTEKDVIVDLGDGEIDLDNGTISMENGSVDVKETDEGLPGFGLVAAILSVGLIARARRD